MSNFAEIPIETIPDDNLESFVMFAQEDAIEIERE